MPSIEGFPVGTDLAGFGPASDFPGTPPPFLHMINFFVDSYWGIKSVAIMAKSTHLRRMWTFKGLFFEIQLYNFT